LIKPVLNRHPEILKTSEPDQIHLNFSEFQFLRISVNLLLKNNEYPLPNPFQVHKYICLGKRDSVITEVGLWKGVTPNPVATGGSGR
jgi:hypothetical protein